MKACKIKRRRGSSPFVFVSVQEMFLPKPKIPYKFFSNVHSVTVAAAFPALVVEEDRPAEVPLDFEVAPPEA